MEVWGFFGRLHTQTGTTELALQGYGGKRHLEQKKGKDTIRYGCMARPIFVNSKTTNGKQNNWLNSGDKPFKKNYLKKAYTEKSEFTKLTIYILRIAGFVHYLRDW